MSETMAEPDWLAGQATDLAKLRAIMAAVHRCFMECPAGDSEPTGPHITTDMAEIFIAQIMEAAETRIRASERERIAAWLEREAHSADESDFDSVSVSIGAASYRDAAEAIRAGLLEAP